MKKALKKALKIALRVAAGFLLLFILLAVLLQIPAIQSSIVHRITSAVSNRTGTTVEVDKVRISFPRSVVVRGVFLDDRQQDTLLAAGSVKVAVTLRELLFKRINVSSISLEDVSLHLSREPADSMFNYYFLIAAFTDTTAPQPPEPGEPSPWSFSLERVNLDHIFFRFDDRSGGIGATLGLQRLRLNIDEFVPGESDHRINRLEIDGLQSDVVMGPDTRSAGKIAVSGYGSAGTTSDTAVLTSDEKAEALPNISIKRLIISNSALSYKQLVNRQSAGTGPDRFEPAGGQSARVELDHFELTNGSVDLENETVTLQKLFLAGSGFQLTEKSGKKEPADDARQRQAKTKEQRRADDDLSMEREQKWAMKDVLSATDEKLQSADGARELAKEKSNWKISIDQAELKHNYFSLLTKEIRETEERNAALNGNAAVNVYAAVNESAGVNEHAEVNESAGVNEHAEVNESAGVNEHAGNPPDDDNGKKSKLFDAGNLEIRLHSFAASGLYYSPEKAGGTISSFSATDGNGFAIEKFGGVFRFDDRSFTAEKFQLATTHSSVAADLHLQYPSLQALQDSIALAGFTLDLRQLQLRNSDLLYFVPQLRSQPYLSNPDASTSISVNLSGSVADFAAADLQIEAGEGTLLRTDLAVTGLPAVDSTVFSVPGLRLSSGRQDIAMLTGARLPEGLFLPDNLSLELAFHGMLNAFRTAAELESSFGDLRLSAVLRPDETFSGRIVTGAFNLGWLLGDTAMFGPVELQAEVTGSGLERSSLTATVRAGVPKLTLNNYLYRDLHLDGTFSNRQFEGRVGLEDENLVFGFDGLVNLQPGEEHYAFRLDLKGAGLKQLNFTEDDIRIGLVAEADVRGTTDNLQGRIDLTGITAAREEKLFVLDSLSAGFTNVPGHSELLVSSKLLEADYQGTVPPTDIVAELGQFMSGYFSLFSEGNTASQKGDETNDVEEDTSLEESAGRSTEKGIDRGAESDSHPAGEPAKEINGVAESDSHPAGEPVTEINRGDEIDSHLAGEPAKEINGVAESDSHSAVEPVKEINRRDELDSHPAGEPVKEINGGAESDSHPAGEPVTEINRGDEIDSHPAGEPAKEFNGGGVVDSERVGYLEEETGKAEEISKVEEADKAEGTGNAKVFDSAYDAANREGGGSGKGEDPASQTNFSFTVKIYNHPILSEVLLPGLTGFEPLEVTGRFDGAGGLLEFDARMKQMMYGGLEINDLQLVVDADAFVVHYAVSAGSVATEQVALANLAFAGNVGQHGIVTNFTSIDDDLGKKLVVHSHLTREGDNYRLVIDPDDLFLMYNRWEIDPANQVLFGEEGVMIDRLFLQNGDREVRVASVNRQFNDDLSIDIRNFRLDDLSQIIENDPELVKGTVNANILVKRAGPAASAPPASGPASGTAFSSVPGPASGPASGTTSGTTSGPASAAYPPSGPPKTSATAENSPERRSPGNEPAGIIADASISNLIVRGVPVGTLTLSTTNPSANRFDLNAALSGAGNDLTARGYIINSPTRGTIDITADIVSLSMKTAEAFAAGQISETAGTLSGSAKIYGSISEPVVTGELHFSEVFLRPAVLNNRLQIADETVALRSDGLFFDSFTVTDPNNQSATINGSVKMQAFRDITLALQLQADNFLLMNTTVRDNETVFGRMVIDSDISIGGSPDLPEVRGRLKLKEGSHATFVVPESRLTTDRGEDVVLFETKQEFHPILGRGTAAVSRSGLTGIDLSTIFEIDRQATLRLLMDPTSTDSLVVQGEAALGLSMDRSGKMSLTGLYSITEGSYLVSLESVIKRRFDIVQGSSITWNGDPLDATLSLDARYTVRTAPYDLVAAQVAGLSDADRGAYRQQVPFWVILKLRGDMLQPEISFAIELPPEEKGALGGALNQKLVLLNQDASALNKQVFALLLLNRFVQENPLQAETGSTAAIVRSTVGNFLSAQLNRLGAGVLPGTELNVDIQSYEEYQTERPQGRTEVEVGIRQQLFNERLSVQLGGSIDVEGERAMQNRASEITGDVRVEYKLTEDGRMRLKGFRQDRYEGALEGQIIETGAGVSYVRDFNEWSELFKRQEKDSVQEKEKNKKEEKSEGDALREEDEEPEQDTPRQGEEMEPFPSDQPKNKQP